MAMERDLSEVRLDMEHAEAELDGMDLVETEEHLKDDESDVIERYSKNIQIGTDWFKELHDDSRAMVKFYNGRGDAQWRADAILERKNKKRPVVTANYLPSLLKIVMGRIISDPVSVNIITAEGGRSEPDEKTDSGETLSHSDIINGMVKRCLHVSDADYQFQAAIEQALTGGFAVFRIRHRWVSDMSFDRELTVECVDNRWGVLFDPSARRRNLTDGNWLIQQEVMSRKAFERRFGTKKTPGSMLDTGMGGRQNMMDSEVAVDQYFERIPATAALIGFRHPHGKGGHIGRERFFYRGEALDFMRKLEAAGGMLRHIRKVEAFRVNWYRIGGGEILEKGRWRGSRIPFVFMPGRQSQDEDAKRVYKGLFNDATDAQRFLNYFYAALIEQMQSSIKQGFLMSTRQYSSNAAQQSMKRSGNYDTQVYLFNETDADGERIQIPQVVGGTLIPHAEIMSIELILRSIRDICGITEADLGIQRNPESGVAIGRRQNQGAVSQYEFLESLRHTVISIVQGWLDAMPEYYDGNDLHAIIDKRGEPLSLERDNVDWGKLRLSNESSVIRVTSARSFETIYEFFATEIAELTKQDNPEWKALLIEWLDNIGLPNIEGLKDRLIATMDPRQLTKKERQRNKEAGEPEPSPEMRVASIKAQAELVGAEAELLAAQTMAGQGTDKVRALITSIIRELEQQENRESGGRSYSERTGTA